MQGGSSSKRHKSHKKDKKKKKKDRRTSTDELYADMLGDENNGGGNSSSTDGGENDGEANGSEAVAVNGGENSVAVEVEPEQLTNVPQLCIGRANKDVVSQKLVEYLRRYFAHEDFEYAFRIAHDSIMRGRELGLEVTVYRDTSTNTSVRICPFCLEILVCPPGLHFQVHGRPLVVTWLPGDNEVKDAEWVDRHREVVEWASTVRTIRDFRHLWYTSKYCVGVVYYLEDSLQVSKKEKTNLIHCITCFSWGDWVFLALACLIRAP
jgi:hypothetical protein